MAGSSVPTPRRWRVTIVAATLAAGLAGSCTADGSGSTDPGASSTSSRAPETTTTVADPGPAILALGPDSPYPAVDAGAVQLRLQGLSEQQRLQVDLDASGERVTVASTGRVRACWDPGRCIDVAGEQRTLEGNVGSVVLTTIAGPPGVVSLTYTPRSRAMELSLDVVDDRTLTLALVPAMDQDFTGRATWGSPGSSVEMALAVSSRGVATPEDTTEAGRVSGGPPLELSHSSSPPAQPVLTIRTPDGGEVEGLRLALTWP